MVHPGELDLTTAATPPRLPPPAPPRESTEPLDAALARLHLTVSRGFLEKLEAAKDALAHACPGGDAAEILERGLDLVLAQHAKRKGLVEKPRKTRRPSRDSCAIPAEVKREVWRRAGGRCEWMLESGERCDCRLRLEYNHILPLALGGESTVENVELTCRPHNLLAARRIFGDAVMDVYAPGRSSAQRGPRRRTTPSTSGGGLASERAPPEPAGAG